MTEKFKVVEIFESINGEGMRAGELAVFVRMQGCNLCCNYCDTAWANVSDAEYREMTIDEIMKEIATYGVGNITLTGGEPLFRDGIKELMLAMANAGYHVEVETNGSISLESYIGLSSEISYTMDYKLAGSGMEDKMCLANFRILRPNAGDIVKFVVSGRDDLEKAYRLAKEHLHPREIRFLLSPVFGRIEPEDIVKYMREKHWTEARLQIQMHKVIWDPERKGV